MDVKIIFKEKSMESKELLKLILEKFCEITDATGFSRMVNNGDGTYTHTSGDGTDVVIVTGSGTGGVPQSLVLNGTTLSISSGNSVDLALLGGSGTDDQILTLTGNTLSIENGNTIDLSGYENALPQSLSLTGTMLTIAGGNTIDIASLLGTDDQTASEVPVVFIPSSYTPSAQNVEAHLQDIDNLLQTLLAPTGGLFRDYTGNNLAGAQDNVNTTFTVGEGVYLDEIEVYLNGQLHIENNGITLTNPATGVFDFDIPPEPTDEIVVLYRKEPITGGGGNGGVQSIVAGAGVTVDNTDPLNPILTVTGGSTFQSVVAGTNITVDNTDPDNPIVTANIPAATLGQAGTVPSFIQASYNPTLSDSSGGATYTVGNLDAQYSKIGKQTEVHIKASNISTTGTPSGFLQITLPFIVDVGGIFNVRINNVVGDTFYSIQGASIGGTTMRFYITNSLGMSNSSFYNSPVFTNGVLEISGSFLTT